MSQTPSLDPATYIQANVNGRLCDAREASLSPLDRSFLYGDAVYEVWRSYDGSIFAWEEHWDRIEATADGIGMRLPLSGAEALERVKETARAWQSATGWSGPCYARLQISRGGGPIGLDTALADEANSVILVKTLVDAQSSVLESGVNLKVSTRWRRNSVEALPPAYKTGNYLNNIQGLREAREAGFDDALFLNADGRLTEASTRNVWLVLPGRIATPPLGDGLLAGVTRRILLESLGEFEGLPLVEEPLPLERLDEALECFLSSTTQDVQPVACVDGRNFRVGPASVSLRLKRRFREYVAEYVASHPQCRISPA